LFVFIKPGGSGKEGDNERINDLSMNEAAVIF
jgi:hypothetical protein